MADDQQMTDEELASELHDEIKRFLERSSFRGRYESHLEDWGQQAIMKLMPHLDKLRELSKPARLAYARKAAERTALDGIPSTRRYVSLPQRELPEEGKPEYEPTLEEIPSSKNPSDDERGYGFEDEAIERLDSGYASELRELLDKIAWSQSSREHVHFWLLWLVELRANLTERVHDRSVSVELLHDRLCAMVHWHRAEREHTVHKEHQATLEDLWDELLRPLYQAGEYEAHQLRDALDECEVVASKNQVEQWLSRMRRRVGERCAEQGVGYHDLREALAALRS
jgi:hypothetical protein